MDDLISNYLDAPKKTKKQRKRLTLLGKKEVVQKYYNYLGDTTDYASDSAHSFRADFVKLFNKENDNQIDVSSLGKWINAERHGEFLPWGGANDLNGYICSRPKIADKIDDHLSDRDVHHGEYNQIAISPSIPNEYGVVARQFTPAGTFLGYYKGECIDSNEAEMRPDLDFVFCIGEEKFIDANQLVSCFARYYNCAVNRLDQNVCVERLLWTNPQKAICFITSKDVQKGEEFLISYGCKLSEGQLSKELMSDTFYRVCERLTKKVPSNYQPQEDLYSCEASDMAREFRDDRSDRDDGNNSADSDCVDSYCL